jgi:hypothetical protein
LAGAPSIEQVIAASVAASLAEMAVARNHNPQLKELPS